MKKVVGYIDYVDNIRNSDGTFDIKAYTKPYCEHCHANHNLRYTCIVRLENGELIQVGYKCLKAVLGYEPQPRCVYSNSEDFALFRAFNFSDYSRLDTREALRFLLICLEHIFSKEDLKSLKFKDFKFHALMIEKHELEEKTNFEEVDKIIEFYKTYEPYNEFTENVKNLLIKKTFDVKYFNIFKYCVSVYKKANAPKEKKEFKPLYTSVETDYTTTKVKSIRFLRVNNYSGYGWQSKSNIYRIIDDKGNAFDFGTNAEILPKENDTIEFHYKYIDKESNLKYTSYNRDYGFINKIRNVRIIKEL